MKKLVIILFLISTFAYSQTDVRFSTVKISSNVQDNSATKVLVQSSDLKLNWILKSSLLSGTNTGDNAVNTNYQNDYRLSNFIAGTDYVMPSGSVATLTTGRTIGMTGDVTYTSTAFNGSANITGTSTVSGSIVKSVVLNTPNVIFSSPINFTTATNTATGTMTLNTQSANTFLAGPTTGVATVPTFRAIIAGDIPNISQSQVTNLVTDLSRTPIQLKDFYSDSNNSGILETDLFSYTTLANLFANNGEKTISAFAGSFNDVTASSQLKVYFAGVVIGDTGALTMSVTGAWIVNVSIMRTGVSTARSIVNISTPGASTASYTKYTTLTGLTFTSTNIIKITGTASGATGGSGDITATYGNVFWQPAAQ